MRRRNNYRLLRDSFGTVRSVLNTAHRKIVAGLPAADREDIGSYVYLAVTWPGYAGRAETIPEADREKELSFCLQLLDICLPDYFRGTSRDCLALPLRRFRTVRDLADEITTELDTLFY